MTCLKFIRPTSETVPAPRPLLQPLTAQRLLQYEHMVAGALAMAGFGHFGPGAGHAIEHEVNGVDAADLEYASWMADPGAIEVDSWAAHLRPSVR